MRIGDPVRVRATGREGLIAEDVGKGRRRVEFYRTDAASAHTSAAEGEETEGIFSEEELEPLA